MPSSHIGHSFVIDYDCIWRISFADCNGS